MYIYGMYLNFFFIWKVTNIKIYWCAFFNSGTVNICSIVVHVQDSLRCLHKKLVCYLSVDLRTSTQTLV